QVYLSRLRPSGRLRVASPRPFRARDRHDVERRRQVMDSRRGFLKTSAAVLTVAATKPLFGWQGANNRVRMAVIGMGGRSARVFDSLTRYDDVQFTMGCEVAQNKQTAFQGANRPLAQTLNVVGDYRRVLD